LSASDRPSARTPFGPDLYADLFERLPNIDHLDVDQLDFRLVALWLAAEKDRVKRRPGCHRAPSMKPTISHCCGVASSTVMSRDTS